MYNNLVRSKIGLVCVIAFATLISIGATKADEDILKREISTSTILITEGVIVLFSLLTISLLIPKMRRKLFIDIKKLTLGNIARLAFYALIGVGIAYVANDALIHHGTNEVKIYQLIIGLLVTGLIYFLTSNKKLTLKKVSFFIFLSVFAVLFSLE